MESYYVLLHNIYMCKYIHMYMVQIMILASPYILCMYVKHRWSFHFMSVTSIISLELVANLPRRILTSPLDGTDAKRAAARCGPVVRQARRNPTRKRGRLASLVITIISVRRRRRRLVEGKHREGQRNAKSFKVPTELSALVHPYIHKNHSSSHCIQFDVAKKMMMHSTRVLSARSLAVVPLRRHKRTIATATGVVTPKTSRVPLHIWLWTKYQTNLDKRPLLTKAVMASFIFFASDSVTQCVIPGKNNRVKSEAPEGGLAWRWDGARALSGAGFGVVATSWLHFWWGFLETSVGRAIPAQRHRLANTLAKVAVDQLLGM